jgi:hypothetical protein
MAPFDDLIHPEGFVSADDSGIETPLQRDLECGVVQSYYRVSWYTPPQGLNNLSFTINAHSFLEKLVER